MEVPRLVQKCRFADWLYWSATHVKTLLFVPEGAVITVYMGRLGAEVPPENLGGFRPVSPTLIRFRDYPFLGHADT